MAAQWNTIWHPSTARRLVVHDVASDEIEVGVPLNVSELNRIAMQVVVHDDLVVLDEVLDQVRSDESGAPRDADTLPFQCHYPSRRGRPA